MKMPDAQQDLLLPGAVATPRRPAGAGRRPFGGGSTRAVPAPDAPDAGPTRRRRRFVRPHRVPSRTVAADRSNPGARRGDGGAGGSGDTA